MLEQIRDLTYIHEALIENGLTVAAAESCSGGLVGAQLSQLAGSSAYFKGSVVAYANEAKVDLLGVDAAILADHGAVSEEVALAMASGVRTKLGSDLAISLTGIAGPGGGSEQKPVGTVWLGWASRRETAATLLGLVGSRSEIRAKACEEALARIRAMIDSL